MTQITGRESVPAFVGKLSARHPELKQQVYYEDMLRIADRDGVLVRHALLPAVQRGRTIVVGTRLYIRLNRTSSRSEQAATGMHELCHIWRDGLRQSPYYSDELTGGRSCAFADLFAWYVTSTARPFFDPALAQLKLDL